MKTINKHQLYKFCVKNGACKDGLRRLRSLMRSSRTAREILEQYKKCNRERYVNSNFTSYKRGSDYSWLVRRCYTWKLPEDVEVQKVIDSISGANK